MSSRPTTSTGKSTHGPDSSLPDRKRMVHRAFDHVERRSKELDARLLSTNPAKPAEMAAIKEVKVAKKPPKSTELATAKEAKEAKGTKKSTKPSPTAVAWIDRLHAVRDRLKQHAKDSAAVGLTEPDAPSGEQWTPGQVWAHVAEFPAYWCAEWRLVLDLQSEGAPPFGRVKSDAGRIAAIAAGRQHLAKHQFRALKQDLALIEDLIRLVDSQDAWSAKGTHSTRGVVDTNQVLEEFIIGHLEQHADQLDDLVVNGAARAAERPVFAITAFVDTAGVDPVKLVNSIRKCLGDSPAYVTAAELDFEDAEELRDLLGSDD